MKTPVNVLVGFVAPGPYLPAGNLRLHIRQMRNEEILGLGIKKLLPYCPLV